MKRSALPILIAPLLVPLVVFSAVGKPEETWRVTNGLLAVTVSARDAGAVCSLVYDGKEFVNDHDHGRQLQAAWIYNDLDEAYNPTEAGSGGDGMGPRSTSRLVSVQVTDVSVYDSQVLEPLVGATDGAVYVDSTYRSAVAIGLIDLIYNMARYEQIVRLQLLPLRAA